MTHEEPTDSELLTAYVSEGSETAFGQLVRRHLGLVYSAALRQLAGDSGAAQDVAQLVFTDLARKASTLRQHGSLAGWLHTSTRFLSAKARRTEERRHLRESTAFAMNPADPDSAAWDELRPVLDDALHELPETDRSEVAKRNYEIYNRNSQTFRLLDEYFREERVVLHTFIELGSMEAIKELVKLGLGVSIMAPWICEDEIGDGSLVALPLGRRKLVRSWGVMHWKGRRLTLAEETFVGLCRSVSENLLQRTGSL
jgi:DNA-directed RNA polymerase specialized sigma24 family protein